MLTDQEFQDFDDNSGLRYRDSASLIRFRKDWSAPARTFANTVVALTEQGADLETARWAAGQATMFNPGCEDVRKTVRAAVEIMKAREAA